MTVDNPRHVARSFPPRNSVGSCEICGVGFVAGGSLAFFAAVLRDRAGNPVFDRVSQLPTVKRDGSADFAHQRRPDGCTCRNMVVHGKGGRFRGRSAPRCGLYRPCNCGTRDQRRHKAYCANKIAWITREGVWGGMIHSACARDRGMAVHPDTVLAMPGYRTVGTENREGAGSAVPAPAAFVATVEPEAPAPSGLESIQAEAQAGAEAVQAARRRVTPGWVSSLSSAYADERAEAIAAREAARAESIERGRRELAERDAAAAAAAAAESDRARVPDCSDSPSTRTDADDVTDASIARFRLLDLD